MAFRLRAFELWLALSIKARRAVAKITDVHLGIVHLIVCSWEREARSRNRAASVYDVSCVCAVLGKVGLPNESSS
jgi:hypothetical protein